MTKLEMDNYMKQLIGKCNVLFPESNKLLKIDKKDFNILNIYNYSDINKRNYTISQLKQMTKHYNLTSCGNKKVLVEKIYFHLHNSFFAVKIQKIFRGFLQRSFNKLFGPALSLKSRHLCTNTTDFIQFVGNTKIAGVNGGAYKGSSCGNLTGARNIVSVTATCSSGILADYTQLTQSGSVAWRDGSQVSGSTASATGQAFVVVKVRKAAIAGAPTGSGWVSIETYTVTSV
jgi:hypothetical protein